MPVFGKSERILKRAEFTKIAASGKRAGTSHFVVISGSSVLPYARLGITVSRKVGNAVSRNRIKRLVREFFRLNRDMFSAADFSIIARRGSNHLDYSAVCQELANALSRIGQQNSH